MKRHRSSPERIREIEALAPGMVESGMSYGAVAAQLNCDRKTVWAICKRLGIKSIATSTGRYGARTEAVEEVNEGAPASTPLLDRLIWGPTEIPDSTYHRASARIASAELARRVIALHSKETAQCR